MKNINYYKVTILILFFSAIYITYKDCRAFIEAREINKITESSISTLGSKKVLSYSPTIKNLVEYEGVNIIKVEASKANQDLTAVQIEYTGNLKNGREIFNSISKDSSIKAIKNIYISNYENSTKIKAEIDYLSNIICK